MHGFDQLLKLVREGIRDIDFPNEPSLLYEPIRYALDDSGKRIRPVALLMGYDLFGDDVQSALPAALAVEVFHNFTLLHDDIMDKASTRRGKPAVYRRWDENAAILSGDVMMIYAYKLLGMSPNGRLQEALGVFNDISVGVCEGQSLDMLFESRADVTVDEYLEMVRLKTAVLLAGAFKIGAMLGGATLHQADILYTFGLNIGLAFQIQDDLLDTYSDEAILGKTIGGDILVGKKTFLLTTAFALADEDTKEKLHGLLGDISMPPAEKIEAVKEIYEKLSVREVAEQTVKRYFEIAFSLLEVLDAAPEKLEPIKELADIILNRKK